MDIPDYTARTLREASIDSLLVSEFPNGKPSLQVSVRLGLVSADDPEIVGPSCVLRLGMDLDKSVPVSELEDAAIRAVYGLLNRFSKESLESVRACMAETRERSLVVGQ